MTIFLPAFSVSLGALADQKGRGRFDSLRRVGFASVIELARLHGPPALQTNKAATNGRLLRWPPFAKGSLSGSWDRICGSSGLWRLLPRLSWRRHNSWRSAN